MFFTCLLSRKIASNLFLSSVFSFPPSINSVSSLWTNLVGQRWSIIHHQKSCKWFDQVGPTTCKVSPSPQQGQDWHQMGWDGGWKDVDHIFLHPAPDLILSSWSDLHLILLSSPKLLLCNSLLIEMLYTPLHPMQCYLLPLRKIRKFTIIAKTVCQKGNWQGGKRLFHICFTTFKTPFLCVDDTRIHTNLNWWKKQSL